MFNLLLHLLKPILIAGFLFLILMSAWSYFATEDYDNDSVTITFNCQDVLQAQNQFPKIVIEECIDLRKDLTK